MGETWPTYLNNCISCHYISLHNDTRHWYRIFCSGGGECEHWPVVLSQMLLLHVFIFHQNVWMKKQNVWALNKWCTLLNYESISKFGGGMNPCLILMFTTHIIMIPPVWLLLLTIIRLLMMVRHWLKLVPGSLLIL